MPPTSSQSGRKPKSKNHQQRRHLRVVHSGMYGFLTNNHPLTFFRLYSTSYWKNCVVSLLVIPRVRQTTTRRIQIFPTLTRKPTTPRRRPTRPRREHVTAMKMAVRPTRPLAVPTGPVHPWHPPVIVMKMAVRPSLQLVVPMGLANLVMGVSHDHDFVIVLSGE